MTDAPPMRACRVCGMVLMAWERGGEVSYVHGRPVEPPHPADPAPIAEVEIKPVCDFCSEPDPPWCVETDPTKPHEFPPDAGLPGYTDDGLWAACEACKRLIDTGEWPSLADRAVRSIARRRGVSARLLRPGVEHLHAYFRSVYTGDRPPRRIR